MSTKTPTPHNDCGTTAPLADYPAELRAEAARQRWNAPEGEL